MGFGRFLFSVSLRFCWISPAFGEFLSRWRPSNPGSFIVQDSLYVVTNHSRFGLHTQKASCGSLRRFSFQTASRFNPLAAAPACLVGRASKDTACRDRLPRLAKGSFPS